MELQLGIGQTKSLEEALVLEGLTPEFFLQGITVTEHEIYPPGVGLLVDFSCKLCQIGLFKEHEHNAIPTIDSLLDWQTPGKIQRVKFPDRNGFVVDVDVWLDRWKNVYLP